MKNRQRILYITTYGLMISILTLMGSVPFLGFITLNTASITIIHIPVLIGAYILKGKSGLILGLSFGLISYLVVLNASSPGPTDVLFLNPMISIFPRVIFGLTIMGVFSLIDFFFKHKVVNKVVLSIASFVLTVLHTSYVLTMINVFEGAFIESTFGSLGGFIWVILLSNGFIEAVLAALIVPPVVIVLTKLPFIKQFHKE
jgi:uncharacterized membrane protein